jgi:hypothetical protein
MLPGTASEYREGENSYRFVKLFNFVLSTDAKRNSIRVDVGSYYVFRRHDLTERLVLVPRGSQAVIVTVELSSLQVRKCT